MSLRNLPEIRADHRLSVQFDARPDALDRWRPDVHAATEEEASISVYDIIGEGWDGEGVTTKRVAAALRSIGQRDVVVNVNSPGGDFFVGVSIYNLLREHKARVTVRVLGLAASAASIIAMAGDEIQMGDRAFLMIHNAWALAIGNRHDLAQASKELEPFDAAMAKVYADRSGMDVKEAAALMDRETWMNGEQAIERGLADSIMQRSEIAGGSKPSSSKKALALVEASLAKSGLSRDKRRDTLKSLFSGMPSAAEPAMPCAGTPDADALSALLKSIRG